MTNVPQRAWLLGGLMVFAAAVGVLGLAAKLSDSDAGTEQPAPALVSPSPAPSTTQPPTPPSTEGPDIAGDPPGSFDHLSEEELIQLMLRHRRALDEQSTTTTADATDAPDQPDGDPFSPY